MTRLQGTARDQVLALAEAEGIPVLGVGPASAMDNERPGHRPEDLLPGASSLICFGLPVPRGVYHTPVNTLETVWRSQNLNYRRLDTLSMRLAALLEEQGARAVPIYGCQPMGVNHRGHVEGYLNQLQMGRATGVGVVGKSGLLLHSYHGARLMLGGVVTTAELPTARYPEIDEPGCPPDCRICADACPVHAISLQQKRVRIMTCLGYTAQTPQMSRTWFFVLSKLRPDAAARWMSLRTLDEHTFHVCSRCVALCPYGEGTLSPTDRKGR